MNGNILYYWDINLKIHDFKRRTLDYMRRLTMNVSIIFATYNRANILKQVFDKWKEVDAYTKYSYEIICSDDESSDTTVQIIEEAAQELPITLIRNKKGGAGRARNAALEIAKGEVVIFTGDDMYPEKDFIDRHYENHLKFGDKVATLGRIDWHRDIEVNYLMHHITEIGCEQFGFIALPAYGFVDFRHFYTSNISVSMKLIKSQKEYFSTKFDKYGFEDIEFGYRLYKNGMKIYYDPDIVVEHHHIYDSIQKFCMRQINAGEELVVFHKLQSDLEDKCVLDAPNCLSAYKKYMNKNKKNKSFKGTLLLAAVKLEKLMASILENYIKKKNSSVAKSICSGLYASIFRFYYYLGFVQGVAKSTGADKDKTYIVSFMWKYMRLPFHQIYWDFGQGMDESLSRKWICWDKDEVILEKELENGIKKLRFAPIKDKCQVEIREMYFIDEKGDKHNAEVIWHNSCNTDFNIYDFSNTTDPHIVIENIKPNYKKIIIRMKVLKMRKVTILQSVKRILAKAYHRLQVKTGNMESFKIEYAYGQPRKLQVIVEPRKNVDGDLIEYYNSNIKIFGDNVKFIKHMGAKNEYATYIYRPKERPLNYVQMQQVIYELLNNIYDYVLVSKSYQDFPEVTCSEIEDVLVYTSMMERNGEFSWNSVAQGRYMRLPSFNCETTHVNLLTINPNIKLKSDNILVQDNSREISKFRISERVFSFEKKKPVIFVFPIFLAVGGVERNTVEVMRRLKNEYTFCMITMEHHTKSQGSLHYQLEGICDHVYDLKEIVEFDNYLPLLHELNNIYSPDIIWLCNNSPWFEKHTAQIRKIFRNASIIAQDVYDTKVGWIEYYNLPEVQKFNRYIAITELIKDTFINKYKISEHKIDVIYPVVDDQHIRQEKINGLSYIEVCRKYNLDSNRMHFATIGRITEQKNPIRYLKMVKELIGKYPQAQFIMVGDGNLNKDVDEYIQKNGMEQKVIRIPYISNAVEFIKILDGLVILSVFEGMPIVSIEAMSFGVPIISTDVGDLKRFLMQTQGGVILDESKSDVENFEVFFNNLKEYKENAEKWSDKILQFFSAENIAELYKQCFNKEIH